MKKKNLNFNFIVYSLFFLILFLFFVNLVIDLNKSFEEIKIDLRVEVNETIGIIINDSIVDFGVLPAGINSNKKVVLHNDFDYPIKVKAFVDGNISNYIFGEGEVFLLSNSQEVYNIELYLPEDIENAVYTGNIVFKFYKI